MKYEDEFEGYEVTERPRKRRSSQQVSASAEDAQTSCRSASRNQDIKKKNMSPAEKAARAEKAAKAERAAKAAAKSETVAKAAAKPAADLTVAKKKSAKKKTADASKKNRAKAAAAETYQETYSEKQLLAAERKRKKSKEKQRKRRVKQVLLVIMILFELVILGGVMVFFWGVEKFEEIQRPNWGKLDVEKNTDIPEEVIEHMTKGYTDIMVFGVDAGGRLDGGSGADVNILVHINNDTGEVQLVSFYRDLYLNTSGNTFRKLTDIYRKDGALGAISALNRNFDLQIDQFVTVSWSSIAETINHLGGIDINVPQVMVSQMNGYITDTVKNTGIGSYQLKSGGFQHLDGIQTVAFCRIRKINVPGYSMGDFGRTERQRQVIGILLEKAKNSNLDTLVGVADLMFPKLFSNLEISDVLGMLGNVFSYQIKDTQGFPFTQATSNIANSIVYSKDVETDIQTLHTYLYGDDTGYVISKTAMGIADKLYSISGVNRG